MTGTTGGVFTRDAAGRPVPSHVVDFVTSRGEAGQVWVPDSHYDTETVQAVIAIRAALADAVAAIPGVTGQTPGIYRRASDGTAIDGVLIDFVTPGGQAGQVWTDYASYDPVMVQAAIDGEADRMRQVGQLAAGQGG